MIASIKDMQKREARLRLVLRRIVSRHAPIRNHLSERQVRVECYRALLSAGWPSETVARDWSGYISELLAAARAETSHNETSCRNDEIYRRKEIARIEPVHIGSDGRL